MVVGTRDEGRFAIGFSLPQWTHELLRASFLPCVTSAVLKHSLLYSPTACELVSHSVTYLLLTSAKTTSTVYAAL